MNAVVSVGPMALLAALIAVPIYYLIYRYAPQPKRDASVVRYLLLALAVGVAAYVIGTIAGVAVACGSEEAGNLCGFAGIFGVGPLLAAAAVLTYAHLWARSARRAP